MKIKFEQGYGNEQLWHGSIYCGVNEKNEMTEWFKQNCKGEYNTEYRFNSGDPTLFYNMKDPEDAALFKLTWVDGTY